MNIEPLPTLSILYQIIECMDDELIFRIQCRLRKKQYNEAVDYLEYILVDRNTLTDR